MASIIAAAPKIPRARGALRLLAADFPALLSTLWLLTMVGLCIAGHFAWSEAALELDLRNRNLPPQIGEAGWKVLLGTDSLGRSVLARIGVAGISSISIALTAVLASALIGSILGLVAGYFGGFVSIAIMRLSDMILSFPLLLLALIVLYVFGAGAATLIAVLSVARMPVFARVVRAEVLELRHRQFVDASRSLGAGALWVMRIHMMPLVLPTMLTVAAVNVSIVMLFESGLSFLGLGVQPPSVSWGLMVAQGRAYLDEAWWLTAFPGFAIMATTVSFNLLASWYRTVSDPQQRWRLEGKGGEE